MTTISEFRMIPLAEVHESKHNPRKHFDGPALEQLADSIRKVGVLTPALVRPNGKGYELAAGHRRYRASKLAALEQLPCLVRAMTDQEFLEVCTIENLQREDVHPLDEAAGYEALMAAPYKMPVEKIAERVGKSVKYIYDRVKLLALCKEARDLFWSGMIEAGHAILLARLSPTEQAKVIGSRANDYQDGGLLALEYRLFDSEEEEEAAHKTGRPVKAKSVRELEAWIKHHIRFNARQADAFLFPETVQQVGAASTAKRKIIEITHDYLVSDDVCQAGKDRIYGERAWKRADGREDSMVCDRAALGVIVCGPGQGQAFDVCVNKDKCLVHWGVEIKARQKRQKDLEKGGAAKAAGKKISHQEDWRLQHQREQKERERWHAAVPALRMALAERVKKAPVKVGSFLVKALVEEIRQYRQSSGVMQMVPPGKTAEDLLRHLGWLYVSKRVEYGRGQGERVVTALGLDVKKFLPAPEAEKPVAAKSGKAAKKKRQAA